MLISPFSKAQLERIEKIVVTNFQDTPERLFIDMVYIDSKGRHSHTVTWTKTIKNLKESLWCDCTNCSNFELNTRKWCVYKGRAALWLVEKGFWKSYIKRLVDGK